MSLDGDQEMQNYIPSSRKATFARFKPRVEKKRCEISCENVAEASSSFDKVL
jgi:hypothetical protein